MFVRSMKKLERLRPDTSHDALGTLLRMHQSLLITKERLVTALTRHNKADLGVGGATAAGSELLLWALLPAPPPSAASAASLGGGGGGGGAHGEHVPPAR